ncbi:hypothetical protein Desca_0314 [Desulfotomaculum nigrificans CO-1-SRB]|uniref:Uncharacterized protein n=1 Tax=Desulfotomaculum nigrificans (strain DSM 14880 / VKM B-2319 / CO-1-SRB) TaxID=868595 RepID=F6B6E0_DESCC|nr:hypothetical protein Desca_0314 [Desulfotomaculum nigrificans CO-1-SRB]
MPGFSGTGPTGKGPMTGRGRGYCIGYVDAGNVADVANFQRGMRRRRQLCGANNVPGAKMAIQQIEKKTE